MVFVVVGRRRHCFGEVGAPLPRRIARFELLSASGTNRANATRILQAREGEVVGDGSQSGRARRWEDFASPAPWLAAASPYDRRERERQRVLLLLLSSMRSCARNGPWRQRTPFSLSEGNGENEGEGREERK